MVGALLLQLRQRHQGVPSASQPRESQGGQVAQGCWQQDDCESRAQHVNSIYARDVASNSGAPLPLSLALQGIIQQFCQTGSIVEATQIRSDPANAILFTFMDLYGIGPVAARELYEDGCRTVDDVVAMGKSLATHLDVKDCLRILPDLRQPIPRREVEEIARLLWEEARGVLEGCKEYTICGGYRRGKPRSNDVDVVICREPKVQDGLGPGDHGIHELVTKLKRRGLMAYNVNVMRHTEGDADNAVHLDVAEIVFLPPRSALVPAPKHRRVDLVLCPPSIYGAAVLGWTGAKTFEKDLRRWAKTKGYKFHSTGLRERETNKVVPTRTEEDVFELLGLRYMPPQWRNTDA